MGRSFERRFAAAYASLLDPRGLNLVPLAALRAAIPVDRDAFDRGLLDLRWAGRFVLHTFDGRHGRLSPSLEQAAIVEGDRVFVYVARRSP